MTSTKGARRRTREASVTLREVAEKAGVHPGTVSRALHGDERVAPATLQHIQRIALELNYMPNIAARVLAIGKTQTIAIATGSINEHYYARIIHFLEKELTASNYKRLILSSQQIKGDLISVVNASAVDGVIAIDSFPRTDELRHSPDTLPLPCVYAGVANSQWTDMSIVDIIEIDLSQAVCEAVQAMLSTGCQRVAYVVTNTDMSSMDEVRARVYTTTLQAANCKGEIINLEVGHTDLVHDLMREHLIQYIRENGCPDGLLCQNDEVAIVVQSVVKELGLHIPDDVQIVGCDGLPYMEFLAPALSTIVQPAQQMCALAWQFLQNRLNDPSLPRQHAALRAHLRMRPSLKMA